MNDSLACCTGRLLTALVCLIAATSPARDVAKLYQDNCSACHGPNLEGGQAHSLLDAEWRHGGDDASIAQSIRDGYPDLGMPDWKATLSEAEIRAMVVFIREKRAQDAGKRLILPHPAEGEVVKSQEHSFRLETVATNLSTPWSLAFLPGDRALLTELPGRLRELEGGRLLPQPVEGTPPVRVKGQGGLLAVAPHPGFATNGWIYLAFSDPGSNSQGPDVSMTAVVRGRIRDHRWVDQQTIFRAPLEMYRPTAIHFGTRLVFDGEGHLFFSIGERGFKENAQDLTRPNGKVHRVFDDGRIPGDNPFLNVSNAIPSIWSYGHRNPQGLRRHPVTGDLWETEHGPRGGDELNFIQKGLNYGWPVITYGMDYNGSPIAEKTAQDGMEQPVVHWTPSIAVCALEIYEGDRFPRWRDNLFVTALAQQELRRLVVKGHTVEKQEVLFKNVGRVRDVVVGPEGYLYVVLNSPDKVIRLVPAGD